MDYHNEFNATYRDQTYSMEQNKSRVSKFIQQNGDFNKGGVLLTKQSSHLSVNTRLCDSYNFVNMNQTNRSQILLKPLESRSENRQTLNLRHSYHIQQFNQKEVLKNTLPKIHSLCKDKVNQMVTEKMIRNIIRRENDKNKVLIKYQNRSNIDKQRLKECIGQKIQNECDSKGYMNDIDDIQYTQSQEVNAFNTL